MNSIVEIWNEVEDDFPEKSTEFLMQMTCDRYFQRYGKEIDNCDVAGALFEDMDDERCSTNTMSVEHRVSDNIPEERKRPCNHVHDHVVAAGRGSAFNVYRCRYCGEEEWL